MPRVCRVQAVGKQTEGSFVLGLSSRQAPVYSCIGKWNMSLHATMPNSQWRNVMRSLRVRFVMKWVASKSQERERSNLEVTYSAVLSLCLTQTVPRHVYDIS